MKTNETSLKKNQKLTKLTSWRERARTTLSRGVQKSRSKVVSTIERYPLGSFVTALLLLVVVAVIGNAWRKPQPQSESNTKSPISVPTLIVGSPSNVVVPATVQKSGVLKVTAQAGGVVQHIKVQAGQTVSRGQVLTGLSVGYAGGSPQSLSRQVAQKNYQTTKDNLPTQLDLIAQRRQLAQNTETMSSELRQITRQSFDDTRGLIDINEEILESIDEQLADLESTNAGGVNDAAIDQLKQARSGVLSGLSALRSGLRTAEYQGSDDQEPATLARASRDITLKQLELEERGMKLSVEIAELNLKLAQFSESLLYPASPCSGTVERVYLRFGQSIQPGAQVASIVCNKTAAQALGLVSATTAQKILLSTDAIARTDTATGSAQVLAVSTEPTDGPLHSLTVSLADEFAEQLADAQSIRLELPVVGTMTSATIPFIPLDAIYQTQTQSFVYVAQEVDGMLKAHLREVELGLVYGNSVEVRDGLDTGDKVILSRSVSSGDLVVVE